MLACTSIKQSSAFKGNILKFRVFILILIDMPPAFKSIVSVFPDWLLKTGLAIFPAQYMQFYSRCLYTTFWWGRWEESSNTEQWEIYALLSSSLTTLNSLTTLPRFCWKKIKLTQYVDPQLFMNFFLLFFLSCLMFVFTLSCWIYVHSLSCQMCAITLSCWLPVYSVSSQINVCNLSCWTHL